MNDDEVGYGKPPKHGQFKKGQSGNPKGRPKGSKNFANRVSQTFAVFSMRIRRTWTESTSSVSARTWSRPTKRRLGNSNPEGEWDWDNPTHSVPEGGEFE